MKFHQCRGALSGLLAALLAEQKFLATREFLTAKDGGLYNTYANGGRPEAVTADLGKRWELEQIALRLWPSASSIQGMNTALFDLVEQHKIDPARVKKVRVALSQPAFDLHGKLAHYKAKFDALISGHYTAAVILHDQELTLAQFEPARYDDPSMRRAAAEQIEIRPDAALTGVQAVVDIEIDGSTLTARCEHPRGSAENPLSRAQIEGKFRTYANGVLTASAIAGAIDAVGDLENLSSVRKLMDLLRPAARRGSLPQWLMFPGAAPPHRHSGAPRNDRCPAPILRCHSGRLARARPRNDGEHYIQLSRTRLSSKPLLR